MIIRYNKTMDIKYIIIIAVVFLIAIVLGLAIVNYSGEDMVDKFKKLSVLPCGLTPVELANFISTNEFGGRIRLCFKDKYFSDAMSSNFVLNLSSIYATQYNFAGVTICAHELGHAYQFRDEMPKMIKHAMLVKISRFFSFIFNPMLIIAIIFLFAQQFLIGYIFMGVAGLSFLIAVLSKLSTIGVEKQASKKAIELLKIYANFTDEELTTANTFLKSAKMTYVADLLKMMLGWTGLVRRR